MTTAIGATSIRFNLACRVVLRYQLTPRLWVALLFEWGSIDLTWKEQFINYMDYSLAWKNVHYDTQFSVRLRTAHLIARIFSRMKGKEKFSKVKNGTAVANQLE